LATYTHYAHTANSWALGDDVDDAVKELKVEAGTDWLKRCGHEVVEFSRAVDGDDVHVNTVTGALSLPDDVEIKVVEKHRPTPKYRNRRLHAISVK
jgi:hypothetical protein